MSAETRWLERLYPSLLVGSIALNAAVCYAVLGVLR